VSILTGKTKKTSGQIFVNGKEQELSKYKKLIGFVPQDDIMLREMTVQDVLLVSIFLNIFIDLDSRKKYILKDSILRGCVYRDLGTMAILNDMSWS
jgi:ABC-type multidrug transport system ATPase subunit